MRRTLALTAVAGGTVAVALSATGAFAGPVATASTPTTAVSASPWGGDDAPGQGRGVQGRGCGVQGQGRGVQGQGHGAQGQGRGQGQAIAENLPASGTLTAAQLADLAYMAEEEKLAHDVYVALADATGDSRFTRIAASETRHLEAMRTLLARYEQADPTDGKALGEFVDADFAASYTDFVARGSTSLEAALEVGRTIERMDIADLTEKLAGLSAADAQQVYGSLLAGSQNHLRAFGG